jgi:hypothetical protein
MSGALGIAMSKLTVGYKTLPGKKVWVDDGQLGKQQNNIRTFVAGIE